MSYQHFEDFTVGGTIEAGPYNVTVVEMVEFAMRWDPLPIHTDEVAAKQTIHGGLIASGVYTIAIKQSLIMSKLSKAKMLGALGWETVRFVRPVRGGDKLSITMDIVSARASRTKPDRGIVRFGVRMSNQDSDVVLATEDVVMFIRRQSRSS